MNRKNLIRQGGTPIGYFDGENAVMDAAFIGCDTGRRLVREGRAVRWQNGLAEKLRKPGTERTLCAPGAGLPAEADVDPVMKLLVTRN